MTEKETIDDIAKIMCDYCLNDTDETVYACVCKKKPCDKVIAQAENLYNVNYRKTIWHKLSDGDLPEYAGLYLVVCGDESLPEYDVDFYENFWNGKRWVHNEGRVIACTELPEYKEEL